MERVVINPEKFIFQYLPDYAKFLMDVMLEDYVETSLAISREEDLPLLRALSKYSDSEFKEISLASAREVLEALSKNEVAQHIRQNVYKFITNTLGIIETNEVAAEDVTLVAFIRRKAMSCFLPHYTDDHKLKKDLIREIDHYTTQEELVTYNAYINLQHEKLNQINKQLEFKESLLLEAQEITKMGSYYVDYMNPENSSVSPQVYKIIGYDDYTKTETFLTHVHPDDYEFVKNNWENVYNNGGFYDYSYWFSTPVGMKRLRSKGIVTLIDGKAANLRGTIRDITAEYELVQKLTESEALHKQAQQLTHLGNWSWEINSNKVEWSDEMYRIYGLEPQSEEITLERFMSLIHPDSRQKRMAEIQESLETGVANDYILKIVTPAKEEKILSGRGSIILDSEGKPSKMIGTCQDITREYLLNQELVELNNTLSEKNFQLTSMNRELESFNYIASHDLQEPLRKIQIFAGRLSEQDEISEQNKVLLNKITSSASRMQQLISDLIEFSQISSPVDAFQKTSLSTILDEVKVSYLDVIESGQVVIDTEPLPVIEAIPFQFTQLFNNIISNAIKYSRPETVPHVKVSSKMVPADQIPDAPDTQGTYLQISVCDNGIGFPAEQRSNIFDLFKRLHSNDQYSGTGIGLAICKKIVSNHQGFIRADSNNDHGSCFHIYIPKARVISK